MAKGSSASDQLIPVRVLALLEEPVMHSPVVILHDITDNRVLPIWIGDLEARAIGIALQKVEVARPLTHTLLAATIHAMGGEISHTSIDQLEAGTFYALITIDVGEKNPVELDCRPSDAIALALEVGAPLFVAKSILDSVAQDNPFPKESMKKKGAKGGKGAARGETAGGAAFPKFAPKAKTEFSSDEVDKLKAMLEKAREQEGEV